MGVPFHTVFFIGLLKLLKAKNTKQAAKPLKKEQLIVELKQELAELKDCEPQFYSGLKWVSENSVEGDKFTVFR